MDAETSQVLEELKNEVTTLRAAMEKLLHHLGMENDISLNSEKTTDLREILKYNQQQAETATSDHEKVYGVKALQERADYLTVMRDRTMKKS
jgi:hypothetical protein